MSLDLPDQVLFAVLGLAPAPGPDVTVAGGVQVEINCDPAMVIALLRGVADSLEADLRAERIARTN